MPYFKAGAGHRQLSPGVCRGARLPLPEGATYKSSGFLSYVTANRALPSISNFWVAFTCHA